MKKLITFALIAAVFAACSDDKNRAQELKDQAFQSVIDSVALAMTNKLPVMIDNFTRLDSVKSGARKSINYYYTLVSVDLDTINANDSISLDEIMVAMDEALTDGVKNNASLEVYRSNDAVINYHYFDRNSKFLFDVSITPDKYVEEE